MFTRSRARAFTLMELTIVLAVLTVLLGVAMPRWSGGDSHRRGAAARDRLVQVLRDTQQVALAWGQDASVEFGPLTDQPAAVTVRVVLPDGSTHSVDLGASSIYRQSALRADSIPPSMTPLNATIAARITFDRRGRLAGLPAGQEGYALELAGAGAGTEAPLRIELGAMGHLGGEHAPVSGREDEDF